VRLEANRRWFPRGGLLPKRHLLTETIGMLLAVIVRPAKVQDLDGVEPPLRHARRLFPFIERIIGEPGGQH
jgi:hypothetical protein